MTHKIRGVDVEKCAYYVNKLRQKVGLETWIWRQIVTSQTAYTKHKWPPYALNERPPMKIFCVRHCWEPLDRGYFIGQRGAYCCLFIWGLKGNTFGIVSWGTPRFVTRTSRSLWYVSPTKLVLDNKIIGILFCNLETKQCKVHYTIS